MQIYKSIFTILVNSIREAFNSLYRGRNNNRKKVNKRDKFSTHLTIKIYS